MLKKKLSTHKAEPLKTMEFLDHVKELRYRFMMSLIALIIGSCFCFIFYTWIIDFLSKPFESISKISNQNNQLYIYSIFEGFTTKIKISLLSSLLITSPFHLLQLIRFIFPGLHSYEKKIILYSLIASSFLIFFGFYISFFKIIPYSIGFLTEGGFIPKNVGLFLNYKKNIFYVFQFLFFSLILFQMPIILELMLVMKIVSRQALLKSSRYIIIGIFILSALITPPDPVSQLGFALPLIFLFYLTILIAKIFNFGSK